MVLLWTASCEVLPPQPGSPVDGDKFIVGSGLLVASIPQSTANRANCQIASISKMWSACIPSQTLIVSWKGKGFFNSLLPDFAGSSPRWRVHQGGTLQLRCQPHPPPLDWRHASMSWKQPLDWCTRWGDTFHDMNEGRDTWHACNWVLSSYTVYCSLFIFSHFLGLWGHLFAQERWRLFTGMQNSGWGLGLLSCKGLWLLTNELTNRDVPLAGVLDRPSKANAKPMIHAGVTARRNLRAKIHFQISISSEEILTLCFYQSRLIARNSLEMDRSEHWFVPLCRGSPAQCLTRPESSRAWHGRLKVVGVVRSIQICVTVGDCERFCLTTRCMMAK